MGDLKTTPLNLLHLDAGAKMGAYAGYSMPLFYPLGLIKEHLHTRKSAGLFDISHMLHLEVSGNEAANLIERACPLAASTQPIGSCNYTFFLNEEAGIIDDLIVTRLGSDRYLIVANAGCAEKDRAHIEAIAQDFDAEVKAVPRGFIALQGPLAKAVLADQNFSVSQMAFMSGIEPKPDWFISRSGYTGEDGFEIAMPTDKAEEFTQKLLADDRVELIGLGARDSLRLEAGLSLYGQDLDETITPHEAGLIWAISKPLRSGGKFIGAPALEAKLASGRSRKRIGLITREKMPVRAGAKLFDADDNEIGLVTSGGFGPTFNGPVAIGMINADADNFQIGRAHV